MKNLETISIAAATAAVVVAAGLFVAPHVFAGRIAPGITVGNLPLGGAQTQDLNGILAAYEEYLRGQPIELRLREQTTTVLLGDLDFRINTIETIDAIQKSGRSPMWPRLQPVSLRININETVARNLLHQRFANALQLPQNASLKIDREDQLLLIPGKSGEQIDIVTFEQDLRAKVPDLLHEGLELASIKAPPPVQDSEVEAAQKLGQSLIKNGMQLSSGDQVFDLKPFTVRRLIAFVEKPDPGNPNNQILGIALNPIEFKSYLDKTITPEINTSAVNARFAIEGGRAEQFAVPREGKTLNLDMTALAVNDALSAGLTTAQLAVDTTQPDISDTADIEKLGVSQLLASGQSDFKGSPKNRIHNIEVGSSRYHGILIPPNGEFSFLDFLGPVDGDHGFKPELVIKNNVTTPEFGGGLCQVSTTAFRAAVESGLKIVERHNHSYAVRYYGTPGFDATIYPPYTDLRFLNNTPAYILIQTKIEGSELIFEFWGTKDGRAVTLDGPHPYNRQSSGAVKATLKQTVVSPDGQTLIEDTFYSNYKSPSLFPHVVAKNGELLPGQVAGAQTNVSSPTPSPASATNPRP